MIGKSGYRTFHPILQITDCVANIKAKFPIAARQSFVNPDKTVQGYEATCSQENAMRLQEMIKKDLCPSEIWRQKIRRQR